MPAGSWRRAMDREGRAAGPDREDAAHRRLGPRARSGRDSRRALPPRVNRRLWPGGSPAHGDPSAFPGGALALSRSALAIPFGYTVFLPVVPSGVNYAMTPRIAFNCFATNAWRDRIAVSQ